jgi:O-antigen ligase
MHEMTFPNPKPDLTPCRTPAAPASGVREAPFAFVLIAAVVLIVPLAHTISLRYFVLCLLLLFTVWASLRRRVEWQLPAAWAWLLWSAVATLSLLGAVDPRYSLGEVRTEVVYNLLTTALAATWVRSVRAFSQLVVVLIVGNLLMVGYAVFDMLVVHETFHPNPILQGSLRDDRGPFSTYLVTVMPLLTGALIVHRRRWMMAAPLLLLLLCNVLALYFTGNRMGFVALLVQIGVFCAFLLRHGLGAVRRAFVLLAPLVILLLAWLFVQQMAYRGLVASLQPVSVLKALLQDTRWQAWTVAWSDILSHPLIGGGFGRETFKHLHPGFHASHPFLWHAHNTFLNIGVQMGIPGILAFITLLAATLRSVWPLPLDKGRSTGRREISAGYVYGVAGVAMLAGMIVKNLTDDFFIDDNAVLFWVLSGALAGAVGRLSDGA